MNKNPMDGSSGVKILVRFYIDPMPRSENGVNEQIIFSTAWSTDQMKNFCQSEIKKRNEPKKSHSILVQSLRGQQTN